MDYTITAVDRSLRVLETLAEHPGISITDIAALTGTSRQTVTTILNELKEKNLINFDRKRILVRDLANLK